MKRVLGGLLLLAVAGVSASPAGAVSIDRGGLTSSPRAVAPDQRNLPAVTRKWEASRVAAADLVARGLAVVRPDGKVRLQNGQFVDYKRQGSDHIVTILADFTDPAHGQIPEPDRTVDNSTYWVPNFDRTHYRDMLFTQGGGTYGRPSVHDYYLQQSSGRYTVKGQVSRWVHIPHPESAYGANSADGAGSDNKNGPVYRVIGAALNATKGVDTGIDWSPSVVDVWDRYDCDGDGNFNEPDGYVDHFQVVHAGEGEDAGGGAQGGDAIWSHRSYANYNTSAGPAGCKLGGYKVPGTNLWVGDYTIEAENGGAGVFAHEFGHDLGLPDLYDTTGGAENGTSFWTIMSQGSWGSVPEDPWIGDRPTHEGPWEKIVLGFVGGSDLATYTAGSAQKTFVLGPAEGHNTSGPQILRINLPDYTQHVTVFPPEGSDPYYYYSDRGDNLETTMTHTFGSPLASDTTIAFRTQYEIEKDWDYAYVEYTADGSTWTPINGNLSTTTNPNGQNIGFGITGTSAGWVDGDYTIPAGATAVRFRYWTDGATGGRGFAADSIKIGDGPVDDGTDTSAWQFDGFSRVENGSFDVRRFHYYLVESRSYLRNDDSLRGAYNFLTGTWLEKQPYADGLLIWYRNSGYADNNVSEHPGYGQILPIDSHPLPALSPFGKTFIRTRWQMWDAPFGLDSHSITLHRYTGNGVLKGRTYNAGAANVFFDDSKTAYWDSRIPYSSVKTAGSGLRLDVLDVSSDRSTYKISVH
jgi:immune inhibitor A